MTRILTSLILLTQLYIAEQYVKHPYDRYGVLKEGEKANTQNEYILQPKEVQRWRLDNELGYDQTIEEDEE